MTFKTTLITRSLALVVILLLMSLVVTPAHAANPSPTPITSPRALASPTPIPSPTPIASPTAETTEKLQQRIKNIVESAIDKVKATPHGYIGTVQRVTSETITIQNKKGTQIISLTPDVSLVKKGKAITVDDISVGDWVMVIGHQQDDDFSPELIDVATTSLQPTEHLINLGTLSSVTKTGFNFQALSQSEQQQITFAKTSQILDSDGNPLTYKQLPTSAQVLVVAIKTSTGWDLQELRLTQPLSAK